jgi:hypothetical protein
MMYIGLANNGLCGRWVEGRHFAALEALLTVFFRPPLAKGKSAGGSIGSMDLSENTILDDGMPHVYKVLKQAGSQGTVQQQLRLWYNGLSTNVAARALKELGAGSFKCNGSRLMLEIETR